MEKKEIFKIDLKGCETGEEVMTRFSDVLNLPDYFGGNLDALYDVLCEPREKIWHLDILVPDEKIKDRGDYISSLCRMLQDASEYNEYLEVNFL